MFAKAIKKRAASNYFTMLSSFTLADILFELYDMEMSISLLLFSVVSVASAFCLEKSCLPSLRELQHFNTSIGGHLIAQRPVSAPCYSGDSSHDDAACKDVREQFFSDEVCSLDTTISEVVNLPSL